MSLMGRALTHAVRSANIPEYQPLNTSPTPSSEQGSKDRKAEPFPQRAVWAQRRPCICQNVIEVGAQGRSLGTGFPEEVALELRLK